MNTQKLFSYTRQAIDKYNMIDENDKIAIGVSGGKDSLTLLYALAGLKKFYPKHFDLIAICVDLGFNNTDYASLNALTNKLNIPFKIIHTKINEIVFDIRKESNPCSLCAKMRKGALNNYALECGFNKIAYAHHKDDIINTMLMSLFYEGHFYSFPPVMKLDKTNLTIIRPLMFVSESEIIGFKNKMNLPILKNQCTADGNTKRQYVKQLVAKINRENPGVKERMFSAIINGNIQGW